MLKKTISFFIIVTLIIMLINFIINPIIIINTITNGITLFVYKVFPNLFFFFIIADLLQNYNFNIILTKLFNKPFKHLFHIEGNASFAILMSTISGFPSGSKYIKSLLEKDLIKIDTANYLMCFTHFSNIAFIIGTVGFIINNRIATLLILICHFLSNFIIALIIRPKNTIVDSCLSLKKVHLSFSDALSQSIINNIKICLLIFGSMLFFSTLTTTLTSLFYINGITKIIFTGIMDLTSGINLLSTINISLLLKSLLALSILSFGSLSVHMQVLSIIKNTNISYKNFLFGRISQVGISILLFLIISWYFYQDVFFFT